uniref:LIM-domain binding protein-domain-containing protein n=1 Tax=Psilocybe cubensis TaxID=181762 RepID=A0A8H8CLL6_PSICU
MNGPLRQSMHPAPGLVPSTANMLAIGNPPFLQNPAHMVQPSLSQGMGVPPNMNPSSAPMGILSNGQVPPNVTPRYGMQSNPMMQQHSAQQQRPPVLRQPQNPPHLAPGANPSLQMQMQSAQFPGIMQQQPTPNNAVRRVPSQPQPMPLGAMQNPAAANMGMNVNMSGLGMQSNMPAAMRQPQHPNQQSMRMQQQPPSMQITDMRNPPPNQGMQGMPRAPSTPQVMNSLPQPPSIGSMQHNGMQPPLQQNSFSNGGPMPSQQLSQPLSSSPRPPQNHTPSLSMGTPGPSQTPLSRPRMTPENSFIGYPQFPTNPSRINPNPLNYPNFAPPSTPPVPIDIPQTSPGMIHSQGTPTRSFPTSQQFEIPMDIYPPNFGSMPPPSSVPHPRPPSLTNPHPSPQQQPPNQQQQQASSSQQQQMQPRHQSPTHIDPLNPPHPQRPQSQPQQGPGRPPSQTATHTPRSSQMSLPQGQGLSNMQGPLTAMGRIPTSQQTHVLPVATLPTMPSRPPIISGGVPPLPPSVGPSVPMPNDVTPSSQAALQRTAALNSNNTHSGILRLLQFSNVLSGDAPKNQKFQLHFWNEVVKEYFTPKAVMKLTLWRDNLRTEAKPFEIGVPILPRFFLVTTQSGVKSMTLTLDGARERPVPPFQGRSFVECMTAVWTYRYTNGYIVMLKGPLTVNAILTQVTPPNSTSQAPQYIWKFDDFTFDANAHEKFISLEYILGNRVIEWTPPSYAASMPGMSSQAQMQQHHIEEDKRCEEPRVLIDHGSIPGEPVNAFGIPQATMRCLELAESVSSMADLIAFVNDTQLGPLDALKAYANRIRETMAATGGGPMQQSQSQSMNPPLPQTMITNQNTNQNNNTNNGNNNNTGNSNNNTSLGPPYSSYPSTTTIGQSPSVTLYSSAPSSVTNPQPPNPPSSMNSPQNTSSSSSVNSPEKQLKTILQQQQIGTPGQSGSASSPAVSTGGTTNNTPAMSNTSLKRKQGDASSPTVGNSEQQPAKRGARKKGRTGTG